MYVQRSKLSTERQVLLGRHRLAAKEENEVVHPRSVDLVEGRRWDGLCEVDTTHLGTKRRRERRNFNVTERARGAPYCKNGCVRCYVWAKLLAPTPRVHLEYAGSL